ncbi:SLC13 family permease, partial [Rhizobium sp.]|uniref:SLC13 family permease n=1 Tax=Rhizobium sp. TaxID=391 RepID=UPI003981BFB8
MPGLAASRRGHPGHQKAARRAARDGEAAGFPGSSDCRRQEAARIDENLPGSPHHSLASNVNCYHRGANMRVDQWLSLLVIALMMGAFVWGRYRYDIVAVSSLLVAIFVGIVPAKTAFSGFADDIVIIVGSALIVSAAISRSGIMDVALRRLSPEKRGPRMQLIILI